MNKIEKISVCSSSQTQPVTATDANGCDIVNGATVVEPATMVLSGSNTDLVCNGDSNGTATVAVTGGTSPLSYQWDDGLNQNTSTATNLVGGSYTTVVTDGNSCKDSIIVSVYEPLAINTSTSSSDEKCGQANGSAVVNVSGGTSPYSYLWDANSGNRSEEHTSELQSH